MPFRIPVNYVGLSCFDTDPTRAQLSAYLQWLRQELATTTAALDALIVHAPTKFPTAKE